MKPLSQRVGYAKSVQAEVVFVDETAEGVSASSATFDGGDG
jgi:hypothetical protein